MNVLQAIENRRDFSVGTGCPRWAGRTSTAAMPAAAAAAAAAEPTLAPPQSPRDFTDGVSRREARVVARRPPPIAPLPHSPYRLVVSALIWSGFGGFATGSLGRDVVACCQGEEGNDAEKDDDNMAGKDFDGIDPGERKKRQGNSRRGVVVLRYGKRLLLFAGYAMVPHTLVMLLCVWMGDGLVEDTIATPTQVTEAPPGPMESPHPPHFLPSVRMLKIIFGMVCLSYWGTCRLSARAFQPATLCGRGQRGHAFLPCQRIRTVGFSVGVFLCFLYATVEAMQFVFVYYDFGHQGHLAVDAWLAPSAVCSAFSLVWVWHVAWRVHRRDAARRTDLTRAAPIMRGQPHRPGIKDGRRVYLTWLALPLPGLEGSSLSRASLRLYEGLASPCLLLSLLALLAALLYYSLVFAECLTLAALALSIPVAVSTHPVLTADTQSRLEALALTPYAERYPHTLMLRPLIMLSMWWGTGEGYHRRHPDAGLERRKTDAVGGVMPIISGEAFALGSGADGSPASFPLVRFAYLYTQLALPLVFVVLLSQVVRRLGGWAHGCWRRRSRGGGSDGKMRGIL